jgi:hypothetical protein
MACKSITISGKDHHDEITAKIFKPCILSIRGEYSSSSSSSSSTCYCLGSSAGAS